MEPGRKGKLPRVQLNPASIGMPAMLAVLVLIEAGIPMPVPSDLLMLLVGERAASGAASLPVAVAGLESVVVVGTTALFFALRGPAAHLVPRFGPRLGLTPARLAHATDLLQRRGAWALFVGRTTPGLRTATVIAAAGSNLPVRRALPFLVAGGSLFAQVHLLAGYFVGPPARRAFTEHGAAVAAAVVAAAVVAVAASAVYRHRREGAHSWMHSVCPACAAQDLVAAAVGVPPARGA